MIFTVALISTSTPTLPAVEVTMVTMSALLIAWASSTAMMPIRYSPRVMLTSVCLTTSLAERLKRVMSGVITAPTMKPPATSVAPVARLIAGRRGRVPSVPTS